MNPVTVMAQLSLYVLIAYIAVAMDGQEQANMLLLVISVGVTASNSRDAAKSQEVKS